MHHEIAAEMMAAKDYPDTNRDSACQEAALFSRAAGADAFHSMRWRTRDAWDIEDSQEQKMNVSNVLSASTSVCCQDYLRHRPSYCDQAISELVNMGDGENSKVGVDTEKPLGVYHATPECSLILSVCAEKKLPRRCSIN
jgi:hypothetical protein